MRLIFLLVTVTAVIAGAAPLRAEVRPNFIFILTDDQGWPESSARMHPEIADSACSYLVTPNIERLAREGMRFPSGYAPAPLCTPTRRSVLCGMTPARQRGTEFASDFDPSRHLTIPKALKAVDPRYRCAHLGKWGGQMVAGPEQAGYDESDGETGNDTGGGKADQEFTTKDDPKLTFSVTRRAVDFMERQVRDRRPFYLQVSYYAVHRQIQTRPGTLKKYEAKGKPPRSFPVPFAGMAEDLDSGIGELLEKLDRLGIAGNTYVFFSADNGGAEYEPANPLYLKRLGVPSRGEGSAMPQAPGIGQQDVARLPVNYPLRGSKQWLYEGGVRVPFIVRGPGVKAGSLCAEPVIQYDLLPTLVDLAGGKGPLPAEIDGGSLRPLLEREGKGSVKRPLPGIVFHRPSKGYSAIRAGDFKLVVTWGNREAPVKKELFDLTKDIGEQNDLSAVMPEKVSALYGVLTGYLKSVNAETPRGVTF